MIEAEQNVIEPNDIKHSFATTYHALSAHALVDYLGTRSDLACRLGGSPDHWRAEERGDGNLNLVFVVTGPGGSLVVKQALPYVRMVGPSWPLSLSRSQFELAALLEHGKWGAAFVPAVYDSDRELALIVMEHLTPHEVLRKALIARRRPPLVGRHVGGFLASTVFHTSDLHLNAAEKRRRSAGFLGNVAMCKISEDLIFDEPYFSAPMNRHTSPGLDEMAAALRTDVELKLAAQEMKWCFLNQSECLVHGDLHTGSVMVTDDDTRVIDPEFAFYGPMGFDLGIFMANLLIAFLSQSGGADDPAGRDAQREYLSIQIVELWQSFSLEFADLWQLHAAGPSNGNLYHLRLFADAPALCARALELRLTKVWLQAVGFAGCEMIRRVVGLSHVEDFEGIADADSRAACEYAALRLARKFLVQRSQFGAVADVIAAAREYA